jgi:hypothetical protein
VKQVDPDLHTNLGLQIIALKRVDNLHEFSDLDHEEESKSWQISMALRVGLTSRQN